VTENKNLKKMLFSHFVALEEEFMHVSDAVTNDETQKQLCFLNVDFANIYTCAYIASYLYRLDYDHSTFANESVEASCRRKTYLLIWGGSIQLRKNNSYPLFSFNSLLLIPYKFLYVILKTHILQFLQSRKLYSTTILI
jgi:hypothetical protein